MKKITILSKLKVWQEYCQTFSCRFKAGFSDFFETSRSTKRLVFYATLLLLGIGFTSNSYGQDVGSSAVKANFGIDGDAYSGLFKFQPNPAVSPLIDGANTDDWFLGASGLGVIDQTGANPKSDPIPNPMTNTSFQRRQSIFAPTEPFPFPVVPLAGYDKDVPSTWSGKYLWLDAVYGRDTYVKGGKAETSYFAGSGDKNSDNPSTWNIGTAGSVPQKDDIIDVYAHLRGEGIRLPFSGLPPGDVDPRPFTTLWAYAGASLVVTNGNKHVDFEFFRTALETPADLSVPGKTGPDGGRTAFTFDPLDGSVAIPGTIIISVDYINGGNVPSIRVRVWMSQATFDGYTTKSNSPFNVDKSVAFEKGTGSGDYGYAAINSKGLGVNMWGRVNDDFATFENSRTQAPPWNTWEGTTPTDVDMYTRYQFVEIGINLTAFGLDKRGEQSPCSNILGSLLVKTRSSGGGPNEGAFGSELKDFAGPFLFGNTGKIPVVSVLPKSACAGTAIDLTVGATTDSGPIKYYKTLINNVYSEEITVPTNYTPTGTMTIYARSESLSNPGCYGYAELDITVNPLPVAPTGTDVTACFDNIAKTGSATAGSGETVVWYAAATGSTTSVAPSRTAVGTTSAYAGAKITATGCEGPRTLVTVTINPLPLAPSGTDVTACFDGSAKTGSATAGSGETVVWYAAATGSTTSVAPSR
ncbi:hypothetical protein, partial [uncultured Flavobacterium sp.]|uniref:immunoglobulin domain-containing protein n=1 Tax=uncultured Flavobacterium sp. TaxID=165435 RepID=UPI0030EF3379